MESVDVRGWFPTWTDLKRAPAMAVLERVAFWILDGAVSAVGAYVAWRRGTPSMTGFSEVLLVFLALFIILPLGVLLFGWLASRFNWSRLATASNEGKPTMGNGNRNVHISGANYGPINQGDIILGPISPELKIHGRKDTENTNGTRTSIVTLEVVTPYVTNRKLQIIADGTGIKDMDVSKTDPGLHVMSRQVAVRDDGRMFLIDNPSGNYAITIVTDTSANVQVIARIK
jgi:hypothetical protein